MDPLLTGGIIAGGANLLGNVLGGLFGSKSTKDTNKANMELAKYAYERDLEMWNRNNAYNSPIEQMKRLRAAGLNPNLVYGNGAVGNTSGKTPDFDQPNLRPYTGWNLGLGESVQTGLNVANQRLINNQADKVKQDTKNAALDSFNKIIQNSRAELDYNTAKQVQKYTIDMAKQNLDNAMIDYNIKEGELNHLVEKLNLTLSQKKQVDAATRKVLLDGDMVAFDKALMESLGAGKTGVKIGYGILLSVLQSMLKR